jgi:hypothetical protein
MKENSLLAYLMQFEESSSVCAVFSKRLPLVCRVEDSLCPYFFGGGGGRISQPFL